nr:immunoglobulin light chain junction region [Macaca mulatta]
DYYCQVSDSDANFLF